MNGWNGLTDRCWSEVIAVANLNFVCEGEERTRFSFRADPAESKFKIDGVKLTGPI